MKLNPKSWLVTVAVIAIAILGWNLVSTVQESSTDSSSNTTSERQVEKTKASITINPGDEKQVLSILDVEIEDGTTALDLTHQVADVVTSGEGEMAFVTSINDRSADSAKNEFWELLINGESSQVGAGSYEVQDGDKIEWRISSF